MGEQTGVAAGGTAATITTAIEGTLAAAVDRAVAEVADRARASAGACSYDRRPDRSVIASLAAAGCVNMMVPVELGGAGASIADLLAFTEQLARIDGSTAWVAMTCNEEAGIAAAYLDGQSIAELYAAAPETIIAGSGVARGEARRVGVSDRDDGETGWSVSGRWTFVSGCQIADRWVLSSVADERSPGGRRQLCFVLVDADPALIDETWNTFGLRGTGSHDVVLDEVFVPDRWAGLIEVNGAARPESPFYALPSGLRFPWPKVGVAAGLARAAIDAFAELAGAKTPLNMRHPLGTRPHAHLAIAEAEALLRSGRAWVDQLADEVWELACAGEPISDELHAMCRLACSSSVQQSIAAIERVNGAAGSTANFAEAPFGRLLADARAVAGHFMVGPHMIDNAGRVLLGLDPDDPTF